MYQIKILPKNFSVMWTWDRIKKWFSCKEYSYIFCYKLLLATILSLFFHIINNFFTPPPNPQLFLVPTNCTWLEFLSPYLAPQYVFRWLYIWQRKRLKILLKYFGTCPPVCPPIITVTAYLLCLLPSSHFKCKLSSPTFGVHVSI